MVPEPNLLAHKAVYPKLGGKAVELLAVLVVWNAVVREDIDKNSVVDIHILPNLLDKQSVVHLYLRKVEGGVTLCAEPLEEVLFAKLCRGYLEEAVVVLAGHTHIYIVVPRHNALVVEGANGTTALDKVGDIMFFAHAVNLCQNLVEKRVELFKIVVVILHY